MHTWHLSFWELHQVHINFAEKDGQSSFLVKLTVILSGQRWDIRDSSQLRVLLNSGGSGLQHVANVSEEIVKMPIVYLFLSHTGL